MSAEPTPLSDDAIATVLVASYIGVPPRAGVEPLGPVGWHGLAGALHKAGKRPSFLLGADAGMMQTELDLSLEQAERIARLTERVGAIGFDLDRLAQRGIWALTRGDGAYPRRLAAKLGSNRPPVLFGAGPRDFLDGGGLAIVGSRDVDEAGGEFARSAGIAAARSGMNVVSGGARGVDRIAMQGAIEAEGVAAGILTDRLETWLKDAELRRFIHEGMLVLATPFKPDAGFTARNAMARNKIVYALADFALVVASDRGKGGTWAGAIENLKHEWTPLFVRHAAEVPPGNPALIERGGIPLGHADLQDGDALDRLRALRDARATAAGDPGADDPGQMSLFSDEAPDPANPRSRNPAAD
jgi:predicted Rossmann fold nucleotide-binding protein DprA/Smf involved in DNA uptake